MQTHWKEYFSFTRKERIGVIALVALILIVTVLPLFFSASFEQPDKALAEKVHAELERLAKDSGSRAQQKTGSDNEKGYMYTYSESKKPITQRFLFDPNSLSPEGWRKLGLREQTIKTIGNYLARGARFHKPEDLYKIFGLKKEEADKLIPYVRIAASMPQQGAMKGARFQPDNRKAGAMRATWDKKKVPATVEINSADSATWESLPGIGGKLAKRILAFREKLGGFYSVDQVAETYGLPDSTFQKIKARLQCNAQAIQGININTATEQALAKHPYIGRNLARLIVRYRDQHGPYKAPGDLKQIAVVTEEWFQKVERYLAL